MDFFSKIDPKKHELSTSWRYPDAKHEKACENFLKAILKKGTSFRRSFEVFQKEIQEYGEWKGFAATAIQMGCPGIVDVYRGCKNWRYTLVDSDNRSLVDYSKPETLKTELTHAALYFRRARKDLFLEGDPPQSAWPQIKSHFYILAHPPQKKTCRRALFH